MHLTQAVKKAINSIWGFAPGHRKQQVLVMAYSTFRSVIIQLQGGWPLLSVVSGCCCRKIVWLAVYCKIMSHSQESTAFACSYMLIQNNKKYMGAH